MAEEWLSRLDAHLSSRRVAEGFRLLDQHAVTTESLRATAPDACSIIVRVAEGVDLGYRREGLLKALIDLFSAESRAGLRTCEFLALRMAEGVGAMHEEDLDRAIALLDFVLQADAELGDSRLAAIEHFWKGRAHRKKGDFTPV